MQHYNFIAQKKGIVSDIAKEYCISSNIDISILLNADININGEYLHCSEWEKTVIKNGALVEIYPNIHFSVGAGLVALLAGTTASALTGGLLVAAYAVTALISIGVSFGLQLLMSALFPQEKPQGTIPESQQLPVLSGANNRYRPFESFPIVIGETLTVPDIAVNFWSAVNNGAQEIYHLFCVSAGDVDVWDIKKDDTPIKDLAGIEYYIYNGWTGEPLKWFDNAKSVTQENFSTRDYAVFKATSPKNTKSVSLIFTFSAGLKSTFLPDSTLYSYGVNFDIKIKNESGVEDLHTVYIDNNTPSLSSFRGYATINLPSVGVWSIEVTSYALVSQNGAYKRVPATNNTFSENFYLTLENNITELQWILDEKAVNYTGQSMTLIELKATASDKLSGGLNTINCMARLKGKKSDGTLVNSSNPALLARRLLTDSNITQNAHYSVIDDESFAKFEAHCDKYGFRVNTVETSGRKLSEVISDMFAIGQGFISGASGIYKIYYDDPSQEYIDVVNARNSWGLSISTSKNIELVDGINFTFNNKQKGYQNDTRLVHLDDNVSVKNPETDSHAMINDPEEVYKYCKLKLAMARLRGSIWKFNTDWRGITYQLGQKVLFQHSMFFRGIGTAGKVVGYEKDESGAYLAVILDQSYSTDLGVEYTLVDSTLHSNKQWDIKAVENETTFTLFFTVPIPNIEAVPEFGTILSFGVTKKVGQELLIRNITYNANYTAEVEALQSDDRYYTAISGVIPPFESSLTFPTAWERNKPYTPQIIAVNILKDTVTHDEDWNIKASAQISLQYTEKTGVEFYQYRISIKPINSTQEPIVYTSKEKEKFVIPNISQDETYTIEVVAESLVGIQSESVSTTYYSHELMQPLEKVGGFTNVLTNSKVNLTYNGITDFRPFYYEIKRGSTWNNAQTVRITTELLTLPISSSGTYHIKAVSGKAESVEISSIEIENVSGALSENVIATINEKETLWNGTYSDNEIKYNADDNTIQSLIHGTIYYTVNSEKDILIDYNSPCSISVDLEVEGFKKSHDMRSGFDMRSRIDMRGIVYGGFDVNVQLQRRVNGIWGEWQDLKAEQYVGDGFRFRLYINTQDGVFVEIKSFAIKVDVPDRILDVHDVLVPIDGLTYTFDPPFNAKPTVIPFNIDDVDNSSIFLDSNSVDRHGAVFMVYDKQGNAISKKINFIVRGY